MSYEKVKQAKHCVIGTKQTLKAIDKGELLEVFVANDADAKVTNPVIEKAQRLQIRINYVDSKKKLGKCCGIEVDAAVVGIKKNSTR